MLEINKIHNMNCLDGLKLLKDKVINCCVTSPPYYALRDYGISPTTWPATRYFPMAGVAYEIEVPEWTGCLGLEPTIEMFIGHMVMIFREVKRVLRDDGTLWLNFGDSFVGTGGNRKHDVKNPIFQERQSHNPKEDRYERNKLAKENGLKVKDLMGVPWRVAFALQADGWYLRNDIIWEKTNCMPESVKDRPTKSHEYIFLLAKEPYYYYDFEAIKEHCLTGDPNPPRGSKGVIGNLNKGRRQDIKLVEPLKYRNKRSVWRVSTDTLRHAHFATFPPKLIEPCVLSGCPKDGIVLDPFIGSGTTGMVAIKNYRNYIGFELNPEYIEIANNYRLGFVQMNFA